MSAADALAAIRDRHLYDVDLGRWDQDETGMLDALDAVLALCAQAEPRHDQYEFAQAIAAAIAYNLGGAS
jgi:hypothetical protein